MKYSLYMNPNKLNNENLKGRCNLIKKYL